MTRMLVLVLSVRCVHILGKFAQISVIDKATTFLAHPARSCPRLSHRALPRAQPYTPRPGARGGARKLRMLDGLTGGLHTLRSKCLHQVEMGPNADKGTGHPHNRWLGFPSGCSLPMHTQDDWSRITATPRCWRTNTCFESCIRTAS